MWSNILSELYLLIYLKFVLVSIVSNLKFVFSWTIKKQKSKRIRIIGKTKMKL